MIDNLEFNIAFILEVEKNPELYDFKLADYSNRRITEVIWNNIGEKFKETGNDCRIKWKSIRSAYIRNINKKCKSRSGAGSKKEYYLANYLQFLNPFTKSRSQLDDIQTQASKNELETENYQLPPILLEADAEENEPIRDTPLLSNLPIHPPSISTPNIPSTSINRKRQINAADKREIDYFTPKKKKIESRRDPCELFLLSLVPHMASMSQHQQLTFQRGVLDLLDNIKYCQPQSAPSIMSSSD